MTSEQTTSVEERREKLEQAQERLASLEEEARTIRTRRQAAALSGDRDEILAAAAREQALPVLIRKAREVCLIDELEYLKVATPASQREAEEARAKAQAARAELEHAYAELRRLRNDPNLRAQMSPDGVEEVVEAFESAREKAEKAAWAAKAARDEADSLGVRYPRTENELLAIRRVQ